MPEAGADIRLDKAEFIALWTETMFYGMYTVLFAICIYVLFYSKKRSATVNKPLLATAIVMYTLSTAHVITDFARGIVAFINYQTYVDTKEHIDGPLGYYVQIWVWSSILRQAIYVTNNIVADSLVVYRLYVVWGFNRKVIIGPIIMLIATSLSGYLAVWGFSKIVPGEDVFASDIAIWGTALFALSLSTNIVVTSLIAGRIWWIGRQAAKSLGGAHGQKYSQALVIIIESGAIYSVCLFILLILYVTKANAQYIVYDSLAQIMGIVPTLIIVRVGLGLTKGDVTTFAGNAATRTIGGSSRTGGRSGGAIPMQVHKVVDITDDTTTYFDDELANRKMYPGSEGSDNSPHHAV